MNKELKNTILLLLIAIFISIIINQLQIDMKLQSLFFQDGVWTHKNDEPWQFLYDYGNIPALILSISGFLLLLASYYVKKYIPYRKVALYLIVVMVVGPGLITNSILKDQWGRPRPRNIVEFNGKYEFEPVLTIDVESKGKSFPCGHATMGFYFFALYFLLISKRRKLAFFFFWVAILYGGIIGLARIVQGGHFLSDVIWAGIVVFLTAKWFYIAFKPDKIQFDISNVELAKNRFKITFAIIAGMLILAGLIFLATPYEDDFRKEFSFSEPFYFSFEAESADIILQSDSLFSIQMATFGHGFPGSKIKKTLKINASKDSLFFKQRVSGIFSELNSEITFTFPESLIWKGELKNEQGTIVIDNLSNVKVMTTNESVNFSNEWLQKDGFYEREDGEREIHLTTKVPITLQ